MAQVVSRSPSAATVVHIASSKLEACAATHRVCREVQGRPGAEGGEQRVALHEEEPLAERIPDREAAKGVSSPFSSVVFHGVT